MTFKKGQSGNPNGKPKGAKDSGRSKVIAEIRDLARQHTADAINALVAVMQTGESDAARISAAVAILDRGWGKPREAKDVNVRRTLIEMSDAELIALIARESDGAAESPEGSDEPEPIH